jgi:hypothetical protein
MTDWYCPNCEAAARTQSAKLPYHHCPKLAGVLTALVRVGTRASVVAVERGDYIGHELVQVDANGRPIMSVVTTRDDGQDCIAFPATATTEKE